jgi:hypothetical protein
MSAGMFGCLMGSLFDAENAAHATGILHPARQNLLIWA